MGKLSTNRGPYIATPKSWKRVGEILDESSDENAWLKLATPEEVYAHLLNPQPTISVDESPVSAIPDTATGDK